MRLQDPYVAAKGDALSLRSVRIQLSENCEQDNAM